MSLISCARLRKRSGSSSTTRTFILLRQAIHSKLAAEPLIPLGTIMAQTNPSNLKKRLRKGLHVVLRLTGVKWPHENELRRWFRNSCPGQHTSPWRFGRPGRSPDRFLVHNLLRQIRSHLPDRHRQNDRQRRKHLEPRLDQPKHPGLLRSEEHTSELQS